jgi:hypothetical protein
MPDDDLIAVPSCVPCNQRFSKDDPYFLLLLAADPRTASHPLAEPLIRKAREKQSDIRDAPFGKRIRRQLEIDHERDRFPRIASYIPTRWSYEKRRIEVTSIRILKGIYFHTFLAKILPTHMVYARSARGRNRRGGTIAAFRSVQRYRCPEVTPKLTPACFAFRHSTARCFTRTRHSTRPALRGVIAERAGGLVVVGASARGENRASAAPLEWCF